MATSKLQPRTSYLHIPIGILLVLFVLHVAKIVIVPLVVAVLLTFVLTPIVVVLQRTGLRRTYAVMITVLLGLSLFGAAGYVIGTQIHDLAGELPKHRKEIEAKVATLREGGGVFADVLQMVREIDKVGDAKPADGPVKAKDVIITRPEDPSGLEKIIHTIAPVIEPLAHAGFVIILVIFMLIHREDLRNRFLGLLGDGRLTGTTRVIVDSAQRLSRYLLTQTLINLGFGVLFAIGLYFIDVEYAILWGFVTALMRYVPYIGTWISVLLPLAFSFATAPTWTQPVTLFVYFGVLDIIVANVVEPLLLGHRTGVSPIALLVAAAFWTWLWGPMGLVLSTPVTVCLVAIGQHVPRFRFFALLLGDQPALEPPRRYYQRLLARDEEEAKEVAVEHVQTEGREGLYDKVLLPALAMARRDRVDAGLEAEDEEFIVAATKKILIDLEANPPTPANAEPAPVAALAENAASDTKESAESLEPVSPREPRALILGCPAHRQAEELAVQMLADLLKEGCEVETISTKVLPAEIEARVAQDAPALVFIAVLPPGGMVQARYLCRRLRRRFADLPIVVGYLGEVHDFEKLFRQVRSAGGNYLATSLLQARTHIGVLVQPPAAIEPQPRMPALQEA